MPDGGDGLHLLENVKSNAAWTTIPVVSTPPTHDSTARLHSTILKRSVFGPPFLLT